MTTPTPVRSFQKDPSANLDFGFDWSEWLGSADQISSSSWVAVPGDLVLSNPDFGNLSTLVWVSGGSDGTDYLVTNQVTTRDGRTDERTFAISVVQR